MKDGSGTSAGWGRSAGRVSSAGARPRICQAARALIQHGAAKVICAATHPILSGPAAERLNSTPFEEIIFTNSLPLPAGVHIEKATVLSIAPLLAQAIHEIFEDGSVTNLFHGTFG